MVLRELKLFFFPELRYTLEINSGMPRMPHWKQVITDLIEQGIREQFPEDEVNNTTVPEASLNVSQLISNADFVETLESVATTNILPPCTKNLSIPLKIRIHGQKNN